MRVLRGLGGALLWIVGGLLGLVAVLLCVTVILLPVGLPLLRLSKTMIGNAVRLMMPRPLAHPVKETEKSGRKLGRMAKDKTPSIDMNTKKMRKKAKKLRKKVA